MKPYKVPASNPSEEFLAWLERIKQFGFSYEIVIEDGFVQRVYVREDDDGDWRGIRYGRVFGTSHLSFKQRVYQPRIVKDKLIIDYYGQ